MKKISSIFIILLLSLSLTACGYKLRGALDIGSIEKISVQYSGRHPLVNQIINKLKNNTITINNDPDYYPAIKIVNIRSDKRQLSVNASGRVDEYEISKIVKYEFRFSKDEVTSGQISGSASYDFNESQMQGTKEQELIAVNSIYNTISRKIITKFISEYKRTYSTIGP